MGNIASWKLKVNIDCPDCGGSGGWVGSDNMDVTPCNTCSATGKVIKEVEPKDIEKFRGVPESRTYTCVCKEEEVILRPRLNQLPIGWINWSGELLCAGCKSMIVYTALRAVADKIQQIRESINE